MNKECLASLRFDDTRYDKISSAHGRSFEWIWVHNEYRNWSTPGASRLLYIRGKPGSGKSTLTKYFNHNLLEREPAANSAIVARFFYSHREGELQRSHYSMLRSILYYILNQDEAFFYHRFQDEYRNQHHRELRVYWDYASLKRVLESLQDHSLTRQLYLIIDAVDESEENDRHDILNRLIELCSKTKYCIVKVFVASRPVGELDLRIRQSHNFIELQDHTESDISMFAHSLLSGLNLNDVLVQAREYIVDNAQGVFLWVKLVGEELKAYGANGCSGEEILEFLEDLPTDLEDFYRLMFDKMSRKESLVGWLIGWLVGLLTGWLVGWFHRAPIGRRKKSDLQDRTRLRDGIKMFQFVLFGRRPLAVDELLHALGIPDNPNTEFTPSDESFQKRIPSRQRIISCGGNFLEIKLYHGIGITCPNSLNPQD